MPDTQPPTAVVLMYWCICPTPAIQIQAVPDGIHMRQGRSSALPLAVRCLMPPTAQTHPTAKGLQLYLVLSVRQRSGRRGGRGRVRGWVDRVFNKWEGGKELRHIWSAVG